MIATISWLLEWRADLFFLIPNPTLLKSSCQVVEHTFSYVGKTPHFLISCLDTPGVRHILYHKEPYSVKSIWLPFADPLLSAVPGLSSRRTRAHTRLSAAVVWGVVYCFFVGAFFLADGMMVSIATLTLSGQAWSQSTSDRQKGD